MQITIMVLGTSSLSVLVALLFVAVFHCFPQKRQFRLAVVVIFNLVFLVGSLTTLAPIVISIALIPFVLARYWPELTKKTATPLVLSMIGLFLYFKTREPFVESMSTSFDHIFRTALPFGFSYVMFLTISLLIELRRSARTFNQSFLEYFAVVFFAPAMPAGPFVTAAQLNESSFEKPRREDFIQGLTRFFWGLAKKSVADFVALVALKDAAFMTSSNSYEAWLLALLTVARFYLDFSGSADIAIGLGRTMGFRLNENFNLPFLATSVGDYWRRWHISLGDWFRNYVYQPTLFHLLSHLRRVQSLTDSRLFSRLALFSNILAIFVTMVVIGLWHGVSFHFLSWSLLVAGLVVLSPWLVLKSRSRWAVFFNRVVTFIFMLEVQIYLVYGSQPGFFEHWKALHGFRQHDGFRMNPVFLMFLALATIAGPHVFDYLLKEREHPKVATSPVSLVALLGLAIFFYFIFGHSSLPYIYSRL